MTRVRGPRKPITSLPPAAITMPPAMARCVHVARPPRPRVRMRPRARIRFAITSRIKYGNGRFEALRRRAVLLGRLQVGQHALAGRPLAVERIRVGAVDRHGPPTLPGGVPGISAAIRSTHAYALDEAPSVRGRGCVRRLRGI